MSEAAVTPETEPEDMVFDPVIADFDTMQEELNILSCLIKAQSAVCVEDGHPNLAVAVLTQFERFNSRLDLYSQNFGHCIST